MKHNKLVIILMISCLFVYLPSCNAESGYVSEAEQKEAMKSVAAFFENSQARSFEIGGPVAIDGVNCVTAEVYGSYENGLYILDSFAVAPALGLYYYKASDETYERFQDFPWYAYAVSPDKRFSIETLDIAHGGAAGAGERYLGTTRVIDMNSGAIIWEDLGCLRESYSWSDDSDYVARQYSGRTWTEVSIIQPTVSSVLELPGIDEVLERSDTVTSPAVGLYEFTIDQWLSSHAIRIQFGWFSETGHWVQGSYDYSLLDGSFELNEIEEIMRG